jgi:hypothetical protein
VAIVEPVFGLEDQVVAVVIILVGANEVVVHCGQQLDVRRGDSRAESGSICHFLALVSRYFLPILIFVNRAG